MELSATMPPLTPREQALVSGTKDFRPSDRPLTITVLVAGCGFRLEPSPGMGVDSRPLGAYQTYASANGGKLKLMRNVGTDDSLPPWTLLHYGYMFDLWPAETEEEDYPTGATAVFAFAATVLVLLALVIWGLTLAGVWSW